MKISAVVCGGSMSDAFWRLRQCAFHAIRNSFDLSIAMIALFWRYCRTGRIALTMRRGGGDWAIFDVASISRARQLRRHYRALGYVPVYR